MKPGRNVSATKTNSSFGGRQFQADLGPDLSMHSLENNTDESLVNTASITSTLALRLSKGIMYTRIGTRVMVVLNPCRDLENVEGVIHQRVSEFRGDAASQSSAQLDGSPLSSLNPHLLETVENAYIHLIQEKKDQTILLLGKSGSGKSRTHSLLIDHLLALSSPLPKLAARIRLLSPLFRSLAGSKRGASVELQFSSRGAFVGAKVVLVSCNAVSCNTALCNVDLAAFGAAFGVRPKDVAAVDALRAAVAALRRVAFVDNPGEAAPAVKDGDDAIGKLAQLLGADKSKLSEMLVSRFVSTEAHAGISCFSVVLSAKEAANQRDALIYALNDQIVNWIVFRINKKICMEEVTGYANYIHVLDFPGVRVPPAKGLSLGLSDFITQYVNSKFQQLASKCVYSNELFKEEGISGSADLPMDSDVVPETQLLSLLGQHTNKMAERAQGNRNFDEEFLNDVAETMNDYCERAHDEKQQLLFSLKKDSSAIEKVPTSAFDVQPLTFSVEDWVSSNDSGKRILHELIRIRELTQSSTAKSVQSDSILDQILNMGIDMHDTSSISANLVTTLTDLSESVQDTNVWTIAHLCVSDVENSSRLDPYVVARQVQELKLVDIAHSLGPMYTCHMPAREFADRFGICATDVDSMSWDTKGGAATTCAAIALAFGYSNADLIIGKTNVFLSEPAWRELEAHLGLLDMKRQEALAEEASSIRDIEIVIESVNGDSPDDSSGKESKNVEPLREIRDGTIPSSAAAKNIEPATKSRKRWLCLTWSLTWFIPGLALRFCCKMKRKDVQIAWREKVTLCIISAATCAIVLFLIIGLGRILCPLQKVLSQGELDGMTDINKPVVAMYGAYYQIPDVIKDHVVNQNYLNVAAMKQTVLGQDVSAMFYKTTVWSNYCKLPQPSGFDNIIRTIPKSAMKVWYPHQGNDAKNNNKPIDYIQNIAYMKKGMVARDTRWIQEFLGADPLNNKLIVAYGNVYDLSSYSSPTNTNGFLGTNIGKILDQLGGSGADATLFMEQVRKLEGNQKFQTYMGCMNGLFLTGVVDHRMDQACLISNYIMLTASSILVLIIGLKFFTALQCAGRRNPENHDRYVLVQVPCYTEGKESLLRTFESVLMSSYQDSRKLLFVIADGMIVGSGNDRPTPQIVLEVLGWNGPEPEAVLFQSLGEGMKQLNMAKIYSGYYSILSKAMPYIVVSKVGTPTESNRPGNRGKRDSQLLIMRFLNHIQMDTEMSPMELELVRHFREGLQMDPRWFEYILWIDADTVIYRDAINRLVACLISDSKVIGICGETQVGNEMESWVTMIQVYEYFISHHLSKQFESVFGAVTCLPGCFSMYRIRSSNKTAYLISNDVIRDFSINQVDTLHLKNLLHLGEDRYLTTLMMNISQDTSFLFLLTRNARHRPQHDGKSLAYFAYLVYSAVSDESRGVPLFSLIMIAAIYGVQLVIFMLKGEFQHLGWMMIYIFAIPIYSFYLPIYSFWHFDDFSWGNTRIVVDQNGGRVYEHAEETFDASLIPLKKWSVKEQELIIQQMQQEKKGLEKSRNV